MDNIQSFQLNSGYKQKWTCFKYWGFYFFFSFFYAFNLAVNPFRAALWFVALSAKSEDWVSWLSKDRSRCLHVLWCSYGLLVTCFAVGNVWILLGWIMSCNVIWQCFCTCLLLFRCVLFVLGLILLCSVVSHFPPSPHVFRNPSAFYLHLFAVALGLFGWYLWFWWQIGW